MQGPTTKARRPEVGGEAEGDGAYGILDTAVPPWCPVEDATALSPSERRLESHPRGRILTS